MMYESMKMRVEHDVEKGKISDEYITGDEERQAFNRWTHNFTSQDHPTVIQMGFRYGSLVEDFFTGYQLRCEGWRSMFCNPDRPAFLGNAPISLVDSLNQLKRWAVGVFEVGFSKYSPMIYGIRRLGLLMTLLYSQYAFWPIWSIPITTYAFLPQLALINRVRVFPKDLDHKRTHMLWFGSLEFLLKSLGILTHGFSLTSKVVDDEQSKRYDQGIFDFGVPSPMFVPLTMAALINLVSFIMGLAQVVKSSNLEGLLIQMFIAGFGVVNCWPIYEAMVFRKDKGKLPTKTFSLQHF
ncbi:hypothetical protein GH714_041488 [Hevea brasiliensis]|uniref:Cellulose synthase-like protein G3 n=1 Tax=Hevea brasiliensis TaxID=3981 RepID=A0A6A6MZU2_HEVBR|nr:hypothetical protein GH714_041488 [Hevea brasiliensis]